MLTLRDLFQAVYEMKKKEVEEAKQKHEEIEKADEAKDTQEEPVYQVSETKLLAYMKQSVCSIGTLLWTIGLLCNILSLHLL